MAESKRKRIPRSRGPYGFNIPEAGAMIGLSPNASYAAADRGDIPTIDMGNLRIVPRIPWMQKIGAPVEEVKP